MRIDRNDEIRRSERADANVNAQSRTSPRGRLASDAIDPQTERKIAWEKHSSIEMFPINQWVVFFVF
jgi:hypothetical protein